MISIFSLIFFTMSLFNFLNALDALINVRIVRRIRDLVVGAIIGLLMSQVYFYGLGMFAVNS